jgi:hypothetical protein
MEREPGASQILGEIHTRETHGRIQVALTYAMAVRALQLGLTFRMHPQEPTGVLLETTDDQRLAAAPVHTVVGRPPTVVHPG